MGKRSKVSLDSAIKTLVLLKENRGRLIKLKKHLILALRHIEGILEIVDQVTAA